MAKRLILGRAGAGKTRLVMEEVARRIREGTDDGALLLVPTYGRAEHLKRSLLRHLGDEGAGFLDRSVVTFTSLAERVLGGTAIAGLASPAARDHLLRQALEEARAPVFERVRGFPGFRDRFLALVKEVKEAGLPPERTLAALLALAEGISGPDLGMPAQQAAPLQSPGRGRAARARIEGFAAVLRVYGEALAREGLQDHEDFQRALVEALRAPGLPPSLDRVRWLGVDGFVNFTRLQVEVIDLLAERVEEAVVTLPFDPARPALFEPTRETGEHLAESGWKARPAGKPRRAGGDLARLEATAFGDDAPEPALPDGSVRLLRCADPADEADRVARTAALWIRRDGWKPFEILLVRRSLAGARALLEEAFARHGVPLRVFAPRALASAPVARAGLDLLRIAFGTADGEVALRAVRSGFTAGADATEGDRLAAEIERVGALATAADLRAMARSEDCPKTAALLDALLPAEGEARPEPVAALRERALAAFAVPDRLLPRWLPDPARPDEDPPDAAAAEDAAALSALLDLVAGTARALRREGRDRVAPREFLLALEDSASRVSFQPLDRRLHAVNAVDAVEARQWEARGVILSGLLEKQFPRAPREDLFLRDRERERANAAGELRLARSLQSREEERLLFYLACTRARERLVLSWPAAGEDGTRLLPSSFLDEVLRLWPEGARPVAESRLSDPAPLAEEALDPEDLLRSALVRIAEPVLAGTAAAGRARAAAALVDALASRERGRRIEAVARAAALALDPEARLRDRRLRARFLRPFRTSASALKDLHQCAYLHFASRVLGLSSPEREAEEGLDPLRLGTVAHAALEGWLRGGRREDPAALFDAALASEMRGVRPGLDDHALAVRAREAVLAFARAEAGRIDARPYRPALFEHGFGMGGDGAPALRLLLDGRRIEVRGRFDRVDLAPDRSAVAVDYKMRWRERGYGEEEHEEALAGADPQVPLYWLALRDALGRRPAGVEIAEVGSRKVTGVRSAGAPDSVAPDGAVALDEDAVEGIVEGVRALLARVSGSLARGEIPARPADLDRCGAGNCDFADLCRYERWDPLRRGGGRP